MFTKGVKFVHKICDFPVGTLFRPRPPPAPEARFKLLASAFPPFLLRRVRILQRMCAQIGQPLLTTLHIQVDPIPGPPVGQTARRIRQGFGYI